MVPTVKAAVPSELATIDTCGRNSPIPIEKLLSYLGVLFIVLKYLMNPSNAKQVHVFDNVGTTKPSSFIFFRKRFELSFIIGTEEDNMGVIGREGHRSCRT